MVIRVGKLTSSCKGLSGRPLEGINYTTNNTNFRLFFGCSAPGPTRNVVIQLLVVQLYTQLYNSVWGAAAATARVHSPPPLLQLSISGHLNAAL